jgi:hypothetical protein
MVIYITFSLPSPALYYFGSLFRKKEATFVYPAMVVFFSVEFLLADRIRSSTAVAIIRRL